MTPEPATPDRPAAPSRGRYVDSSPHFLRPVTRTFVAAALALAVAAVFFPAPLEAPADPAHAPNPAKSAWFLLWLQELVSHDTLFASLVVVLFGLLVALPFLPWKPVEHAAWLQREQRPLGLAVLVVALGILALTLVGLYLRGPDWRLVWPA